MANERTFLAWIRTSIAIMAFGFVVERFSLFVKQVAFLLGKSLETPPPAVRHEYSSVLGIFLVGIGALMGLLAFMRYKTVERQIDRDTYKPSVILDLLLTISLLAIAAFLLFYLIHSL